MKSVSIVWFHHNSSRICQCECGATRRLWTWHAMSFQKHQAMRMILNIQLSTSIYVTEKDCHRFCLFVKYVSVQILQTFWHRETVESLDVTGPTFASAIIDHWPSGRRYPDGPVRFGAALPEILWYLFGHFWLIVLTLGDWVCPTREPKDFQSPGIVQCFNSGEDDVLEYQATWHDLTLNVYARKRLRPKQNETLDCCRLCHPSAIDDKNIPPDRKPRARFHFFSAKCVFRYSETVILKSQNWPKNGVIFGGHFYKMSFSL